MTAASVYVTAAGTAYLTECIKFLEPSIDGSELHKVRLIFLLILRLEKCEILDQVGTITEVKHLELNQFSDG